MKIRVAIVEDDASVRETLAALVHESEHCEVVAVCGSTEEALNDSPLRTAEVVLMDINLPGKSGIECARELKARFPLQVMMLTILEDTERLFESLRAGAAGYLVKNTTSHKIIEAILEIHRGGSPISPQIARRLVNTFQTPAKAETPPMRITAREQEILALVSKGYRSKEIADELKISIMTVNTHVRNIYEKLQVRSRAEAVVKFLAKGK